MPLCILFIIFSVAVSRVRIVVIPRRTVSQHHCLVVRARTVLIPRVRTVHCGQSRVRRRARVVQAAFLRSAVRKVHVLVLEVLRRMLQSVVVRTPDRVQLQLIHRMRAFLQRCVARNRSRSDRRIVVHVFRRFAVLVAPADDETRLVRFRRVDISVRIRVGRLDAARARQRLEDRRKIRVLRTAAVRIAQLARRVAVAALRAHHEHYFVRLFFPLRRQRCITETDCERVRRAVRIVRQRTDARRNHPALEHVIRSLRDRQRDRRTICRIIHRQRCRTACRCRTERLCRCRRGRFILIHRLICRQVARAALPLTTAQIDRDRKRLQIEQCRHRRCRTRHRRNAVARGVCRCAQRHVVARCPRTELVSCLCCCSQRHRRAVLHCVIRRRCRLRCAPAARRIRVCAALHKRRVSHCYARAACADIHGQREVIRLPDRIQRHRRCFIAVELLD